MRKNLLPGPRLNLSSWGPLLLAAGLLLVFFQGLLQLYAVQNFFFPGKYQASKLNLISKEYVKIGRGLTSLQDQLTILAMLQQARAKPDLVSSSRPLSGSASPLPADSSRCSPDASWQAAIHAAKKKRVYAARKLNHLRLILQSMQQHLEAKLSNPGSGSPARKPEMEKTLQQIRESRALWQTYDDNLHDLSLKLRKIAECSSNQQISTIFHNMKR
jgi:hypothetical protein